MKRFDEFYIDDERVVPTKPGPFELINPVIEIPCATVRLGGKADMDRAAAAARWALQGFSSSFKETRIDLLERNSNPQKPARAAWQHGAGGVVLSGAPSNTATPMGSYKKSGDDQEMSVFGLEEYLEAKAIIEVD